MARPHFADVDAYIATFPKKTQAILQTLRRAIRQAVPEAEEVVSYQIPTYKLNGAIACFAAYKGHYAMYGVHLRTKQVERYAANDKGTLHFELDKPVPVKLVARIAQHRAKENLARAKAK